eukprot:568365-Prorocentrum_minimum.AAC.2
MACASVGSVVLPERWYRELREYLPSVSVTGRYDGRFKRRREGTLSRGSARISSRGRRGQSGGGPWAAATGGQSALAGVPPGAPVRWRRAARAGGADLRRPLR